jgi:hypothetical protein
MMAAMTRPKTWRHRIFSPLVYLAAIILLLEEWLWELGVKLVNRIVGWPPLALLETRIKALSPYAALCAFVLPAVLLFPVKVLALIAIAGGHPVSGVAVIVAAKIGGAALVARLYTLTLPTLVQLPWFARWHDKFIAVKNRWVGALKATNAFRRVSMLSAMMRSAASAMRKRWRARPSGRHSSRQIRTFRRLLAIWRARRR